jgi:hypothetical protein
MRKKGKLSKIGHRKSEEKGEFESPRSESLVFQSGYPNHAWTHQYMIKDLLSTKVSKITMYMWTFQVCKNKIIWFDIQNLVTLSNFEKTWTRQGFNSQPYLGFKQQMCGMFFVHFGWNPLPYDIIPVGIYSCFFNPPVHHAWNSCCIKGVWMSSSSNNCPL